LPVQTDIVWDRCSESAIDRLLDVDAACFCC
jgi:hypothetical protein